MYAYEIHSNQFGVTINCRKKVNKQSENDFLHEIYFGPVY